ncbi:MAG: outer membrane protein transport protein [Polyangiaceae bacterium]|nr:outer membrane protein transport protein [Polyangiaceae bacterium]
MPNPTIDLMIQDKAEKIPPHDGLRPAVQRSPKLPALAASAAVALGVLCFANTASAGGFVANKYGGLYGNANADGGLAMYWNPARLAEREGFFATVDLNYFNRSVTYERRSADDPNRPADHHLCNNNDFGVDYCSRREEDIYNTGVGTLSNQGVLPYFALGYGLDLDLGTLSFGAGFYPSFGGAAKWDKTPDVYDRAAAVDAEGRTAAELQELYPGAIDGPNRWTNMETELLVLDYALGAGIKLADTGLSFGGSLAYSQISINTVRARTGIKTDQMRSEDGANNIEGSLHYNGTGHGVVFVVGASYEWETLLASVAYHSRQNVPVEGPLRQTIADDSVAALDFPLPDIVDVAFAGTFGKWGGTVALNYVNWSLVDVHKVIIPPNAPVLDLRRDMEDTLAVRLLPTYQLDRETDFRAMVGYEGSAIPKYNMDAGLMDAPKYLFGIAGRYGTEDYRVSLGYTHEMLLEVNVTENIHEPPQTGKYNDSRHFVTLSLEMFL